MVSGTGINCHATSTRIGLKDSTVPIEGDGERGVTSP